MISTRSITALAIFLLTQTLPLHADIISEYEARILDIADSAYVKILDARRQGIAFAEIRVSEYGEAVEYLHAVAERAKTGGTLQASNWRALNEEYTRLKKQGAPSIAEAFHYATAVAFAMGEETSWKVVMFPLNSGFTDEMHNMAEALLLPNAEREVRSHVLLPFTSWAPFDLLNRSIGRHLALFSVASPEEIGHDLTHFDTLSNSDIYFFNRVRIEISLESERSLQSVLASEKTRYYESFLAFVDARAASVATKSVSTNAVRQTSVLLWWFHNYDTGRWDHPLKAVLEIGPTLRQRYVIEIALKEVRAMMLLRLDQELLKPASRRGEPEITVASFGVNDLALVSRTLKIAANLYTDWLDARFSEILASPIGRLYAEKHRTPCGQLAYNFVCSVRELCSTWFLK